MALTNYERVGKALELLKSGLSRYVEREMRVVYFENWHEKALQSLPADKTNKKEQRDWDVQKLLAIIWNHWDDVFGRTLGHTERSIVSELRETRNRWAHQDTFSSNDAHRALDSISRLLTAVSATEEAAQAEQMRMDLLRTQFDEQRRHELRKASSQATEGTPQTGLKPWREVVTPHSDVATGRYQQAEFAADLWQVYQNEGSDEYKDPAEFYRRTFITEGLKQLLKKGVERLSGKGGDPVIELQTNFGGGKTHSMLALYHLFSGTPATDLLGVEGLLDEWSLKIPSKVKRVVLVGTKISPGQPMKKDDGTIVHTLWGEIAWQLGGKEGYEMVRADDEKATNPGDRLKELFNHYAPCLILIDEWVAYARQLHDTNDLPAGTFDTQFTFAQTLSESAKAAKKTMLVVSIPASDNEIGGEWGRRAIERLKNAIGRVESPWRPASTDEGFEIVRRRLFEPLTHDKAILRDAVAKAFVDYYGTHHQEFPSQCRESAYERRIKMAYPLHPELFDRLYSDWSTLDKFQRTRGVLRLMAAVIHCLWEREDKNLLIMPATVPIDDPSVQFELTHYMEDQWVPVIEKDVDGPNALPKVLDNENPSMGRYWACRRVARTIYIGSAPTIRASNRGIDDKLIKLGCAQPGESVATFGDALRRLTDRATYLYVDGSRYWYSTQPTVTRLAQDRAAQYDKERVFEEIRQRLRQHSRQRGDFAKVHVCVKSGDVPDEPEARLVILDPGQHHNAKCPESLACQAAAEILNSRGSSPRTYRNTLAFLAADSNRIKELEEAIRQYLAWNSIVEDKVELNLDQFQIKQADTKCRGANETVEARILEAYPWLIVPSQTLKGEVSWPDIRLQGQDDLAVRASKKLKNDDNLRVQMGGGLLKHELDNVPLWRGESVSIKQLAEDFATYLYLPRLRDEDVLLSAIRDGLNMLTWETDSFAFAESYDEQNKRYIGLRCGSGVNVVKDTKGLLIKPNIASAQMEADMARVNANTGEISGATAVANGGASAVPHTPHALPKPEEYHRFYGTAKIDPLRIGRDAGKIADEVIQLLTKEKDAEVEITIEIRAVLPKGADEKLRRDVTENCRTLKFDTSEFEKS